MGCVIPRIAVAGPRADDRVMWFDRFDRGTWLWGSIVIGFVLLVGLVFFGGQTSRILSTVGGSIPAQPVEIVGSGVGSDTSGSGTGAGSGTSGSGTAGQGAPVEVVLDAARSELLVIKTGTISLKVEDVAAALTATASRIAALGGYVAGSEQTGKGDDVTASVTYRIPSERWDDALAAVRSIGLEVVDEKTSTEDVTGKVVDLGARIANLEATERALQAIIGRATKISDVLAVQAELTKVRGDIERATAEKHHLSEQAALSTLTVGFGLPPKPAVVVSQQRFDPQTQVDRATATLVDILQSLAVAGIWFAIVWLPILLALGFVTVIATFVYRRGPWRGDGPKGGPQPPAPPIDAPASLAG